MSENQQETAKIALVQTLRTRAGLDAITCKRALELCNWELDIAYSWLRHHGTQLFDWSKPPIERHPVSDFALYQLAAKSTANYAQGTIQLDVSYCALGLTGEAGEVANKVKKWLRGDLDYFEMRSGVKDELGDVLWYIAMLADELDFDLDEVVARNNEKLASRKTRNVIKGDGDNR